MNDFSKEYTDQLMLDFGTDRKQLIPVITQNILTKDVLVLSYVNEAAFQETLKSGYATYFSRSRQELWKKGSTSGDFLKVKEIRLNCEQNSLLFMVIPEGKGVCHAKKDNGTPYSTCYYRVLENGRLIVREP